MKTTAATLFALCLCLPAEAATITVDSFADDNIGCTLRKAMANAIAAGAPNPDCAAGAVDNLIQLGSGTYSVNQGRIPMDGPVATTISVEGLGPGATVIDGVGNSVILDNCEAVGAAVSLTVKGVRFIGGNNNSQGDGGAICANFGTRLTLDTTAFVGNRARGFGGAIFTQGPHTTVIDSSFEANVSISGGGAIWGRNATEIRGSYFGQNDGGSSAGALYLWEDGQLNTIDRSTFWGNRAYYGSVFQGGSNNTIEVNHSTVIGNVALAQSGTYWVNGGGGTFRFTNTIIAGNAHSDGSPGGDCYFQSWRSNGHSLLGDNAGCGLAISGPGFNTIGPVTVTNTPADNGGPTKTLVPSDPPLTSVANGDCGPDGGTDQRGVPRPLACTIGAYELEPATVPSPPASIVVDAGANYMLDVVLMPGAGNGRPITGYTVNCGAASASTAGTGVTVGPLPAGVPVMCTAFATTSLGDGPPSAPVIATPLGPPEPPVIGTAVAGDGSVLVSYSPPANDGGVAIFLYSATCAGISFARVNGAINVTGLANGAAVTCTVTATNPRGTSAPSALSNVVTPSRVPDAPGIGAASAVALDASIGFTPPGFDGGSPITGYRAVCNPGNAVSASTLGSPISIALPAGGAYTCAVIATNIRGDSVPSPTVGVSIDATAPAVLSSTRVGPLSVPAGTTQQFSVTFSEPVSGVDASDFLVATTGAASGTVSGVAGGATSYTVSVSLGGGGGTLALGVANNGSVRDATLNTLLAAYPGGDAYNVVPPMRTFSGPSATGTGIVTASFTGGGPACAFDAARLIALTGDPGSPPSGSAPTGIAFPHGLFDFTTTGCDAGSTITLTIDYPAAASAGRMAYYKYGPTPTEPAPHWYVLPSSGTNRTITFSITDGALGDDDLAANGAIIDQGGPGGAVGPVVPTMSEWMLALLALLMAGVAAGSLRHGRRPGGA